jgi:hypothetical protein
MRMDSNNVNHKPPEKCRFSAIELWPWRRRRPVEFPVANRGEILRKFATSGIVTGHLKGQVLLIFRGAGHCKPLVTSSGPHRRLRAI